MIPVRSQWGHYNLARKYVLKNMKVDMAQGHFTMGLGIIFRIWNPLKPSFNSPSFISYIYIIIYIYIYIMCIYIYYIMYIYISHVWLGQTPGKHPIYCDPCWSTSYFSWGAQTPQTSGLVLDQWDLLIFGASHNLWILTLVGPDAHATRRHQAQKQRAHRSRYIYLYVCESPPTPASPPP